jgi:hypothetical protein
MIFAISGQILFWYSIHSSLLNGYNPNLLYLLIPSVLIWWFIALLFAKIKRIGRYKNVERRNFSSILRLRLFVRFLVANVPSLIVPIAHKILECRKLLDKHIPYSNVVKSILRFEGYFILSSS